MAKSDEHHFFEEIILVRPFHRLVGVEFTIGEYDCLITEVTTDEDYVSVVIKPIPGGNFFDVSRFDVKIK